MDPRFCILKAAIDNQCDRQNIATYLNRRYQCLQQALISENHLRLVLQEYRDHLMKIPRCAKVLKPSTEKVDE